MGAPAIAHERARFKSEQPPVRWHSKPCCIIAAWGEHRTQRQVSKLIERKRTFRTSKERRAAA